MGTRPLAEESPKLRLATSDVLQLGRRMDGTKPVTGFDSKTVMLRAERKDPIKITQVVDSAVPSQMIPSACVVTRRTDTYFGPKLLLDADGRTFLLTAPGPDMHLILWELQSTGENGHQRWAQLAEVMADFDGEPPAYNICIDCGEPIQTAEHERLSLIGRCPGTASD